MVGERHLPGLVLLLLLSVTASAQTPPVSERAPEVWPAIVPAGQARPSPGAADAAAPTEAVLGVAIFPSADFITSYDAGQGQRYYLFGTNASFAEVVAYYKALLKDKGELVFDEPPVHEFDIGRFREESMAFPPSVTVKDYAWGPFKGYLNPKPGAQPERYRTIIQFVPPPSGTPIRKD
jgi:hypothetical protein